MSAKKAGGKWLWGVLSTVPLFAIVLIFEFIPVTALILRSFFPDEGTLRFSFDNYLDAFASQACLKAVLNSLKISALSSAAGVAAAYGILRAARDAGAKAGRLITSLLAMSSNLVGVPLAFSFMILLGNSGLLLKVAQKWGIDALAGFDLYSSGGLLLLYTFFQIPLAALLLLPSFRLIERELEDAGLVLGGKEAFFWRRVGIPMLLPSVVDALSIMFANSLCAYGTAYALLMNNFPLLSLNISSAYVGEMVSRPGQGAALSVMLMLIMCLVITVNGILRKRTSRWKNETIG